MEQAGYSMGPVVGEGSYGKVCACIKGSEAFAVKIVSKKTCNSKFLQSELSCMAELKHENIVGLHEVVETETAFYIVMDLAEEGDLLEKVMNNGLSAEEAKKAFNGVVSAIQYSHELNIAHRDIKLENILITKSGEVKVADFGFSCKVEGLCQTTCGSKAFAAPEILQGQSYDAKKADVWSKGVALYAMVSGSLSFESSNVRSMVEQQLTKNISFPKEINSECKKLIQSMLESDVSKRATLSQIMESEYLN